MDKDKKFTLENEWEVIDIEKYSITFKNTSSSAYLHLDIDTEEPFNKRMKIGDKVNMCLGDDDYYAN